MKKSGIFITILFIIMACSNKKSARLRLDFNEAWKFSLGNDSLAFQADYNDANWRTLNLPHDWSIEGEFSNDNPAKPAGGALPGGIGWYRKTFCLKKHEKNKQISIEFDGVFQNSEVWINGFLLGKRPYGYSSFAYDLTPFLNFGEETNTIAVKVDNSLQPNSRWYTGSGIYRNVWLVKTGKAFVENWGTYITTPEISADFAKAKLEIRMDNFIPNVNEIIVVTQILNPKGKVICTEKTVAENLQFESMEKGNKTITQNFTIKNPKLWSVNTPNIYIARTSVLIDEKVIDNYDTPFGIRYFEFDAEKGFFLNGEYLKLQGVNQHHDLGALGAAINTRAIERQLEILKNMGVNAIRTAHNPPAPELLDLCDKMGFLVMDEAFDQWAKKKNNFDYHLYWDEWHERDLADMVRRDRNHPSIFMWSIGNEIREQFDSTGIDITNELVNLVKYMDKTRPVTSGMTEQDPTKNFIYQSGALDVISFNYKHLQLLDFLKNYPGEKLIASENISAFSTRGHYDMPSDSIRIWPPAYKASFIGNDDYTCSSYDNTHAFWGATHHDTWKVIKSNDFISGMFIWSGFDYLGEPDPYVWPARSSYLGIIDLCGFPKDAYYMYQSLWTQKPVLHLFPHWNWIEGELIDVCTYFNYADEVELFLNNESLGVKLIDEGDYFAMWRVKYKTGTIKAVSRKNGLIILEREIKTAGQAAKIELIPDRKIIDADGKDLSFVTVKITDANGTMVPYADNLVSFEVTGEGTIAGVDNGYQASHEPFKANYRKAYNGMCLLIIQSSNSKGNINIEAKGKGLVSARIEIKTK